MNYLCLNIKARLNINEDTVVSRSVPAGKSNKGYDGKHLTEDMTVCTCFFFILNDISDKSIILHFEVTELPK